jgi:hypothetical protein
MSDGRFFVDRFGKVGTVEGEGRGRTDEMIRGFMSELSVSMAAHTNAESEAKKEQVEKRIVQILLEFRGKLGAEVMARAMVMGVSLAGCSCAKQLVRDKETSRFLIQYLDPNTRGCVIKVLNERIERETALNFGHAIIENSRSLIAAVEEINHDPRTLVIEELMNKIAENWGNPIRVEPIDAEYFGPPDPVAQRELEDRIDKSGNKILKRYREEGRRVKPSDIMREANVMIRQKKLADSVRRTVLTRVRGSEGVCNS